MNTASEIVMGGVQRSGDTMCPCNSIDAAWVVPTGQLRRRPANPGCAVTSPRNWLSVAHVSMSKAFVSGQCPVERFTIWRPRTAIGSGLVRGASPSILRTIKIPEIGYR